MQLAHRCEQVDRESSCLDEVFGKSGMTLTKCMSFVHAKRPRCVIFENLKTMEHGIEKGSQRSVEFCVSFLSFVRMVEGAVATHCFA